MLTSWHPLLKWLLSYLSGRTQFVKIDDTKSHLKLSQFGIPQGSILRPMIFNLYVSDLRDNLDLSTFCAQYADDTSLYTQCAVRESESTTCDLNESLTKLQFSAAGFVTGHYVNSVNTLFKLGWLPMSERRDLKQYIKPCMMNIGPGIWGLKLCNTVDAYVPAKLLTLKYH